MLTWLVWFLSVSLASGTVVGLIIYIRQQRAAERRDLQVAFRKALVRELNRDPSLAFHEFVTRCQVPSSMAQAVAHELYDALCRKVFEDGIVTTAERDRLDRLARLLALDPEETEAIESRGRASRYERTVREVLEDGVVTSEEAAELERVRRGLGLTRRRGFEMTEGLVSEAYGRVFARAAADGQITAEEAAELDRFRNALGLSPAEAGRSAQRPFADIYRQFLHKVLSVGAVAPAHVAWLNRFRESAGISSTDVKELIAGDAATLYRALFEEVIADRIITAAELEQMRLFREALLLSEGEANAIIRQHAVNYYRECVCAILQDGAVTPSEGAFLSWLETTLGLHGQDIRQWREAIEQAKTLATWRSGKLGVWNTSKMLNSGEICHWEGHCTFHWQTATKGNQSTGELVVTSERIIFSSPLRSFEFTPGKIVNLLLCPTGVELKTSGTRGNGYYESAQAREIEAVLVGVVRKHKYLLAETFDSSRSRHIPDAVKREVWQRDGGFCVRCGAADYLEFDHIIPHSRGGANTVKNVQVLCRKCNGEKKDRI